MALNTYFQNYEASGEQRLIEDLILESIKIYGVSTYYLPRDVVNSDDLFGEDVLSKFDDAYELEMYIRNVEGFEGEGDFLSRFGLEIRDQMTLTVSRRRFLEELDPEAILRPREGDLIWLPFIKGAGEDERGGIYEIKFVQHEAIFYQLGDLQTYDIVCEKFSYSDERIDTGIAEIDGVEADYSQAYAIDAAELSTEAGVVITDEKGQEIINDNYDKKLVDKEDDSTMYQDKALEFIDFSDRNPFSEGEF